VAVGPAELSCLCLTVPCTSLNPNTAYCTTRCSVAHLSGNSICDLQDHASVIHNYLDRYVGEVMQTLEDTGAGPSANTRCLLAGLHSIVGGLAVDLNSLPT